jgi:eukaryotic-like serine/threonine-protein kinase
VSRPTVKTFSGGVQPPLKQSGRHGTPSNRIVKQIGRYNIVEEIGRGASGVVYRALDPAIFGRTIAIKVIQLTSATDPAKARQLSERIAREARAVAQLSHRHIISIYDVEEEGAPNLSRTVQIFMEFVNGSSLKAMLAGRNLPSNPTLLDFFRQVADGLDYAHRNGIVHRDVKPANLMLHEDSLTGERLAKITDFGVANFALHPETHMGMRGTPSYMAPEQVEGKQISGRTDQFALATVVYEVLTGRKPFPAEHLGMLFARIVNEEPQPAHGVNQSLSPLISRILNRALSKNSAQRFETCTAFVTALVEALNANPQWTVLAPSETRVESAAGAISDETIDAAMPPASPVAVTPAFPTAAPVAPGQEPPLPYELPSLNRRKRGHGEEQAHSGLVLWRKVGIALVLCAMGVALYFMYQRFLSVSLQERANSAQPAPAAKDTGPPLARSTPVEAPPESAVQKPSPVPVPPLTPPLVSPGEIDTSSSPAGQPQGNEKLIAPAAPPPQIAAVQPRGPAHVQFSTSPTAAHIVVDGDESKSCTAPCALALSAGRHTFTVALAGYSEAKRIIQVPEDSAASIELTPEVGTVQVASVPSGSAIYIDGRLLGQTPATLRLKSGAHQIRLVIGSKYHEETINVNAHSVQSFTFRWAPG